MRAFMAIRALLGKRLSVIHDLESIFWVLFWICIHYDVQEKDIGPTEFDSWNNKSANKLVRSKVGTMGDENISLKIMEESFTSYYHLLIPLVNRYAGGYFQTVRGGRGRSRSSIPVSKRSLVKPGRT